MSPADTLSHSYYHAMNPNVTLRMARQHPNMYEFTLVKFTFYYIFRSYILYRCKVYTVFSYSSEL